MMMRAGVSLRCTAALALTVALGASVATAGGALATGDSAKGKILFQERCSLCHTAAPDDGDGGQGPPLKDVVDRPAASVAGFGYTAALRRSDLVWTPANLDRFLAGPGKLVPGTTMPIAVPDPGDRADLIAYLSTVR